MNVSTFLADAKTLANQQGISLDQVLKAYHIKELERRNNILERLNEIVDEGFPNSVYRIAESMEAMANTGIEVKITK